MIKSRPVVVVSPRSRRGSGLVGIVPLSTTAPKRVMRYHVEVVMQASLPAPFDAPRAWVKGDMYSVVALERLDRFRLKGQRHGAARTWMSGSLSDEDLARAREAVLAGLGFS